MEKIIGKKAITAIPGIGAKYAKRLGDIGIKKPRDLLKQYEKLDKDPHRFMFWMKKQVQANSGHARKTVDVVSGLNSGRKDSLDGKMGKMNYIQSVNSNAHRKFCAETPKSFLESSKTLQSTKMDNKITKSSSLLSTTEDRKSVSIASATPGNVSSLTPYINLNDAKIKPQEQPIIASDSKEDNGKDALNQHLNKLRQQFSNMHDTANQKMLELQSELGRLQHMSHEFDVLAEFLASDEKLSTFEQNLDRLQRTVHLTETKINEINTNNHKMGRMIRQINETARKQHDTNDKAINAIGSRLARWELKLDRAARKISNHKFDVGEFKSDKNEYGQLKGDIECMLNERLTELSTDMDKMKNVVFCIISLVVVKMFVFDFFKNDILEENKVL